MIKKIKNIILAAILPLAMAAPMLLAPVAVQAVGIGKCQGDNTIKGSLAQGANISGSTDDSSCVVDSTAGSANSLQDIAGKVVNFLSVIVGIVAVIMIIVGGFRYITSGGDSGNVSTAKNTLIYAIVGLIIVALAQFIVRFVLSNATV